MMKQLAALSICLVALISEACGLNLTPLEVVLNTDGPPQHRYYFQDTEKRLGFRIDANTAASGSADAALFRFYDCNNATMRLLKSPVLPNIPFTGDDAKSYDAMARTLLLAGASKVQLTETKPEAISINGWSSLQFIFSYDWGGYSYQRAITFLNFNPKEQYICDVSSRVETYDRVYARSYKILNSLFDLPLIHTDGPT